MVTKDDVVNALHGCYDPEIPINIVDLGLIYDVDVNEGDVKIKMTLTTPHCPLAGHIMGNAKRTVEALGGVKSVEVELVFEPPWTPERIAKDAMERGKD